jgi:integrase
MTPDEARAILAATRGTDIEAPVGVALYTGMRLGEVLGLRWRNIDLDDGQLRVDAGLQRLNRATRLVETKTERSRRLLPVTEDLTLILRDQQRRQAAQRRAAGANWIDPIPDLVFTNAVGQPLVPTTVTGRFKELLRLAGAPPRRFHDLRHGCATLLLASGTDLKVVSNMLGHSTINITANTYAHVLPALERDASVRLSNLIRAGGRNTGG